MEVAQVEPAPPALRWLQQTVSGDHLRPWSAHQATQSLTSRDAGSGFRIWVPRARYSFSTSFWRLMTQLAGGTPCFSQSATKRASTIGPIELPSVPTRLTLS